MENVTLTLITSRLTLTKSSRNQSKQYEISKAENLAENRPRRGPRQLHLDHMITILGHKGFVVIIGITPLVRRELRGNIGVTPVCVVVPKHSPPVCQSAADNIAPRCYAM